MSAYYNENDPYAAQWLRNLIAAGHIAPGDVDERDIRDVKEKDVEGYTQVHLFAGIGTWSYALRQAGWPDDREVWTGSCPCQPFSAAGKKLGVKDDRHLWPEFHRLIRECRPRKVFGEQVASVDGLGWWDLVQADLERADYAAGAVDLCAAGVGAPHIRQRLWWVAHADGRNARAKRKQRSREQRFESQDGGAGERMAHAQGGRYREHERNAGTMGISSASSQSEKQKPRRLAQAPRNCGEVGRLANAIGPRLEERTGERHDDGQERAPAERGRGSINRLAHTKGARQLRTLEQKDDRSSVSRRGANDPNSRGEGVSGFGDSEKHPRPLNGFWRDADWLGCRDGRWRAVEPGTFPLAHGVAGRVGRLRAYGNSLCAPVAEQFIRAAMNVPAPFNR